MIPKAAILAIAQQDGVLPSTVEKDYALGWLLYGIAQHPVLSRWVFKGGTCLKKCFFETYRFSEDLDFTIPGDVELTEGSVRTGLAEVCDWVSAECGLDFPRDRLGVEVYTNKQGSESISANVGYSGPLRIPRNSLQRIKFDLTQQELIVAPPELRAVFHRYDDRIDPPPRIACYSLNEILAEKSRALYERQGRARDVYDVVNINRNFREDITASSARDIVRAKFEFKKLPAPQVKLILDRIDFDGLKVAWQQQLSHQLPILPPVESFTDELPDALAWWMEPARARPELGHAAVRAGETVLPRQHFVSAGSFGSTFGNTFGTSFGGALEGRRTQPPVGSRLDRVRFAARNRLCVEIGYHGTRRLVEPYSLRHAAGTGNTNLFVYEVLKAGRPTGQVKSYDIDGLESVTVTAQAFTPRWVVEL